MLDLIDQIKATSWPEWAGVICALLYLGLAIREHIACWLFAFLNTLIFSIIFFDVNLYMESLLNLYYLVMAVIGYYQWRQFGPKQGKRPIVIWAWHKHLVVLFVGMSATLVSGWLLSKTDASFPYLDSFTTWFAVLTTYMVTQKVWENWGYWAVINSVSVFIFYQKGLLLIALLTMVYLVMGCYGCWAWWRQYQQYRKPPLSIG